MESQLSMRFLNGFLHLSFNFEGSKLSHPSEVIAALEVLQRTSSQGDAEQRLLENCVRAGLTFHGETPGDGNCFFHAVCDQLVMLGLPHQTADELRSSVVDFLKSHPSIKVIYNNTYTYKLISRSGKTKQNKRKQKKTKLNNTKQKKTKENKNKTKENKKQKQKQKTNKQKRQSTSHQCWF